MKELDKHQKQILRFIERFENQNGHDPSYEEIRQGTGMRSKDHVYRDVQALEARRYVRREPWISRGIKLLRTVEGYPVTPFAYSIPVIAPNNSPRTGVNHGPAIQDWIEITRAMIPDAEDVYAFRVQDDSMLESLVNAGDLVVLKRQTTARNGELVSVRTTNNGRGQQVSIMRYYRSDGEVWLQPENPDLEPLKLKPSEVAIEGLVLCIIRNMAKQDSIRSARRKAA